MRLSSSTLASHISNNGPDENVIKTRQSICLDRRNADQLMGYLDRVLG